MFKSYFRSWNFSPIVTYFWKTYYDLNVILLNLEKKKQYFPNFLSDKRFQGTIVNWALPSLHEGSHEV